MKNIGQKGFTVLETVLILALIGVIGFVGWSAYQLNQEEEGSDEVAESEVNGDESDEVATLQPGELLELDSPVKLSSSADVDNLPEETPESFKDYMRSEMSDFDTTFEAPNPDVDCEQYLEVDLISSINVNTQMRTVEAGTDESGACAVGGGQLIRYLDEGEDQWSEMSIAHQPPTCDELVENNIYEEFWESCLESADDDIENTVPNPNGSIRQLQ